MIGPPAVIGATEILELEKLLIAVEAQALSDAATPANYKDMCWSNFYLSEGI